jgi:hypothetical protein
MSLPGPDTPRPFQPTVAQRDIKAEVIYCVGGVVAPAFDNFTDDIEMDNGPGAGPWHRARGQDDLALLLLELAGFFGDTFRQEGRCVYADDRVSISLIHETGTAPGGDRFDNLAVYVGRLRPDGTTERLWTVDLDAEHCEAFWEKNPAVPSKDFLSSPGPYQAESRLARLRLPPLRTGQTQVSRDTGSP